MGLKSRLLLQQSQRFITEITVQVSVMNCSMDRLLSVNKESLLALFIDKYNEFIK